MVITNIYQNKRNPNKYIEVRHYNCGHYVAHQYMFWEKTGIKNILGSRSGRFFRFKKATLNSILEDYILLVK